MSLRLARYLKYTSDDGKTRFGETTDLKAVIRIFYKDAFQSPELRELRLPESWAAYANSVLER